MAINKTEYQVVTIRIPRKMYAEYKDVLKEQGKIVTYDIRNYMNAVVENSKKKGEK